MFSRWYKEFSVLVFDAVLSGRTLSNFGGRTAVSFFRIDKCHLLTMKATDYSIVFVKFHQSTPLQISEDSSLQKPK
jgi:hypothetical protein